MKSNSNIIYQDEDLKLARFAKALGHPARLAILRHLSSLNSCCFTEIADDLPLAYSTVSEHLTELKNVGLIDGIIESPKVQYCINYENREIARKYMNEFISIEVVRNKTDKEYLLW
jgi:DNA-binding transcriptional ArsR family regulator